MPLYCSQSSSRTLGLWQPVIGFSITIVLPFVEFNVNRITQNSHLCCSPVLLYCSFLLPSSIPLCIYLFIHSPIDGCLDYFCFWLIGIKLLWSFVYSSYRHFCFSELYGICICPVFTHNTFATNCVGFPHTNNQLWHQLGVLEFSSVLTVMTWS